MSRYNLPAAAALLCALAIPVRADRAFVVVPDDLQDPGSFWSGAVPDTAEVLAGAGFDVVVSDAGSVESVRQALSGFMTDLAEEPRILIHLSGRFVNGAGETWLLEDGLETPPDVATIPGVGLPISTVLEIAAEVPGAAVVALGEDPDPADVGSGLTPGAATPSVPQGVTLLRGPDRDVARFVAGFVQTPGRSLPDALDATPAITATGFLSGQTTFLPADDVSGSQPPVETNTGETEAEAVERAVWLAAQDQDTAAAYESYLARYPDGRFALQARGAIETIRSRMPPGPEAVENALGLSRDDKLRIQQDLAELGHAPGSADGVFGPATRAAVLRFQAGQGLSGTGYLDDPQIALLRQQAEEQKAARAAEARRRALEQEQRDRAAWAELGEDGSAAGLRSYLRQFPDGLHAATARSQLDRIERKASDAAKAKDKQDWATARKKNTLEAYKEYLEAHPKGTFSATARANVRKLDGTDAAQRRARIDAENALGLTKDRRLLVERYLQGLGFRPGTVDGTFDKKTRGAIRRYQRDRGLKVTGYMNAATGRKMLSEN